MANINSLLHLILALSTNNKPTTDPSLSAWESVSGSQVTESWEQTTRYITGNNILDNDGCPELNECLKNCRRKGYRVASCIGPDQNYCHCSSSEQNILRVYPDESVSAERDPDFPRADPDELSRAKIYWPAEEDPNIPRVDPDELSRAKIYWPAEVDPNIPRVDHDDTLGEEKGNKPSGGCPSTAACLKFCKSKRFDNGECTGPMRRTCHCYSHHADRQSTLSDSPCPSAKACTEYCKSRGKNVGYCQGYQSMECMCFDHE